MLRNHQNNFSYTGRVAMKMRDFVPADNAAVNAGAGAVLRRSAKLWPTRFSLAKTASASALLAMLALFPACESNAPNPSEAKPEVKPTETLTGRAAFQKVFIAARNYAVDVKPFRIESIPTTDSNGHDGKSAVWRASFASAMQHGVKPFIWSGSTAPDAPSRGVSPGNEDTYNPNNASTQVFDVAFLKIDSDQAFAEAQKHGGDKILEKDPSVPVIYVCDWNHNTNQLVWHVIYGESRETAKLTVAINATTGEFIRVEK
jgi:hypothetical protein